MKNNDHSEVISDDAKYTVDVEIVIPTEDFLKLKQKALEAGLPYQTIISTLIYQYVEGKIKFEI
ncbi:hypothetical protein KBD81_01115 [Candidatus Woesebacteria bacterium]|nr:hypothetical protein [Candidatus Woesebacteria bacterium]